jgi:hypothetical protein
MEFINTVGAANLAIGVVLPFVVALVSSRLSASWFRTIVLLVLSLLAGSITVALADDAFTWQEVLDDALVVWPTAILAHYGLWRNFNLTNTSGLIQNTVPGGLGASTAVVEPVVVENVPFAEDPAFDNEVAEQELYEAVEANEGGI